MAVRTRIVRIVCGVTCLVFGWASLGTARGDGPSGATSSSAARLDPRRVSEMQLRATRRPVAVIDLANDPAVRDVGYRLLELLASHVELAPPAISDGAALVDKLPPDDELRLIDAQRKRLAAAQNLAQRNFREAAIDAVEGQEILLHVTPRAAISLYADLALALGQSRLGEKKDADAREAFALTHRLDPHRTLDDLHYLPEVVQAFDAAKQAALAAPGDQGTISVRGVGQVWIDGEELGQAPGEFKVALGRHVVWLTGMLRETGGKEILVTSTRPGEATIMDGLLTRPQKVARFRLALAQAHDPAARATAMAALGSFVNVHEAVLLSSDAGKITWQVWRDHAPGFSAVHPLGHDNPMEILNQLAPPRALPELERAPLVADKKWYLRTSVHVGVAAAVILAFIGGYAWAHYSEASRPWNSDISGFGAASK